MGNARGGRTGRNGTFGGRRQQSTAVTRDQLALIHVARRECRLDDDEYRALLLGAAGVSSSKDLDPISFEKVLARFKAIGFVHRPAAGAAAPAAGYGVRPGMATDAQCDLLQHLWRQWTDSSDETGLHRWLERSYGISNLRFAQLRVAQMAIEGLKAMVARRASKTSAESQENGRDTQ